MLVKILNDRILNNIRETFILLKTSSFTNGEYDVKISVVRLCDSEKYPG